MHQEINYLDHLSFHFVFTILTKYIVFNSQTLVFIFSFQNTNPILKSLILQYHGLHKIQSVKKFMPQCVVIGDSTVL